MSVRWVLQQLYSLNPSSLNFLRRLHSLMWRDEREKYLTSLQGSELARLVDFLDKVHPIHSAFRQFTKQTPQALGAIPTTDDVARECLDKLQAICAHHTTLPSSHIVSSGITRMGDHPIALGGIADAWEGTYRGEKVSIKSLRVSTGNFQAIKKVRNLCGKYLPPPLKNIRASQSFFKEAIIWKRLRHPNIVPFVGVTTNPLQIVAEWMPNGTLTEFIAKNPATNRIGLVSPSL